LHGLDAGTGGATVAGLQASTAALVHVAGFDPLPPDGITNLNACDPANMARWAPDIRGLLLQTQFSAQVKPSFDAGTSAVTIAWGDNPIWTVQRPLPATLAVQAGLVRNYVDQRTDRSAEILSQLGQFADYFAIILGLNAARNPKTFEMLDTVQSLAGLAAMMPKYMLACRRPDEIDVRIMPLIQTPGHSAFPSAHAAQAFAMAEVLAALLRAVPGHFSDREKRIDLLFRQAHRIAANRTVAGVHFPMDSAAGAALGLQIGRALVGMMTGRSQMRPVVAFDPNADPARDFLFADLADSLTGQAEATKNATRDPLFGWLWSQCLTEFGLGAAAAATS
jgi:membrane-associated phospholipid phosphatase